MAVRDASWFARQLGEGWTSAGDGIYYPPEESYDEPQPVAAAVAPPDTFAVSRRRRDLLQLREQLIERVARFPNAVAERQLREIEQEIATFVRRLRPFNVARQS